MPSNDPQAPYVKSSLGASPRIPGPTKSEYPLRRHRIRESPKIRGVPYFRCPYNKDPTI